jgi:hypothetical protein
MRCHSEHRTSSLPAEARVVLEQLLGRPLQDDEAVSISVFRPHPAPIGEERKEAWRQFNEHVELMRSQVIGPVDELERIVDEEWDRIRHGSR